MLCAVFAKIALVKPKATRMSRHITIKYADLDTKPGKTIVLIVDEDMNYGKSAAKLDKKDYLAKAAEASGFTGKSSQVLDLVAPALPGDIDRLFVFSLGSLSRMQNDDWVKLGGKIGGRLLSAKVKAASVIFDIDGLSKKAAATHAAEVALGAGLRGYKFAGYKQSQSNDNDEAPPEDLELTLHCADADQAMKHGKEAEALAAGVCVARDLVNQPANLLGPEEFVKEIDKLRELGMEIDVLDERAMQAYGMNALLSVGRGSQKPSRAVIMSWWGAKSKRSAPIAFIGKGVTFDTGGISLKPAKGMEDMKGDMGGAACVTGLMHTVAARKAPLNVIGIVGLVENMPSASATRPGDVVTSASGQTVEILNTDAEGRLVLADLLWYAEKELNPRPKAIIDLATLTGAIMIALGKQYAGLFSNDDRLAAMLHDAGEATGEKVWRLPLDKAYDKMIDSPIADMKNIGGRYAGATTAAQFLQRFVSETPWAHLDIAGTAMASTKNEINQSWGSGFGVRLLNDLLVEGFEK